MNQQANDGPRRFYGFFAAPALGRTIARERERLADDVGRPATISAALRSLIDAGSRLREAMAKDGGR